MRLVERPAVGAGSEQKAVPILLRGLERMAFEAKGLQPTEPELIPVASMRRDVIGDASPRHDAMLEAAGA